MNQVITISREYGAGGHSIGKQVAEKLGIPFYDKDIVRETARAGGFDIDVIEREEEDASTAENILKYLCPTTYADPNEAIHDVQKAIILRLAKEGPCVILGRCADHILRQAEIDSINVFIHADRVHRAIRVSELTGSKNANELQKLMTRKDNRRHSYYTHYTGKKWGDSRNYDMTLDSGSLGYDLCVDIIVQAAQHVE